MRRTLAAAVLLLAFAAVVVYGEWFAPEPSTQADMPFPDLGGAGSPNEGSETPAPLRAGSFLGADDFHYAEGTVSLFRSADGTHVLRFEGYDARDGPDVYLYLTPLAGADTAQEVERDGLRLRVPGGAGDGRATVRGSFNVVLPDGVDAPAYGGVTIWCDQFDHFFGHAPLE